MDETVHVTLIANAGVLLEYRGTTLLLDGIYGAEGHPFSNLSADVWQQLLEGKPPFGNIDYLLFSHAHPDHCSPQMTKEYLLRRKVKGVFFPNTRSVRESGLPELLKEGKIPAVLLSGETDRAVFRIEPHITVRAFTTLHLDETFRHVHHFCYLISFDEKHMLFTADVDYIHEDLSQIRRFPLRAAFVNPLFFSELRRRRFFKGELEAQTLCVYHVPFAGEDGMQIRPALANNLAQFPPEQETIALCDALQRIEL